MFTSQRLTTTSIADATSRVVSIDGEGDGLLRMVSCHLGVYDKNLYGVYSGENTAIR